MSNSPEEKNAIEPECVRGDDKISDNESNKRRLTDACDMSSDKTGTIDSLPPCDEEGPEKPPKRAKQETTMSTSSQRPQVISNVAGKDEYQNVKVVARVRPLSEKEQSESAYDAVKCSKADSSLTVRMGTAGGAAGGGGKPDRYFQYDAVFDGTTTQTQVYEVAVGDMVKRNIKRGFNTTILAYGQTGSGKTHTMGTNDTLATSSSPKSAEIVNDGQLKALTTDDGIMPRAVYDLFSVQREIQRRGEAKVELSYLEVYNEEIRDLLSSPEIEGKACPSNLVLRDHPFGGVVVVGLSSLEVKSPEDVSNLLESAASRRATAATAMNATSSRSHAICTLTVTVKATPFALTENIHSLGSNLTHPDEEWSAKLTLVDLAGSERIKRTGAEGSRMKEGININKGLFVLGQVVSSLSEIGQQADQAASTHIPYRDSKLTRLLQDSLGGNSRTVMVACVSPASSNADESINTLRYAERTRNIKNSAIRNVLTAAPTAADMAALRRENQKLKLQLAQALSQKTTSNSAQPSTVQKSATFTDSEIMEGMEDLNIEKLDLVTKMRAYCTSLQTRVEQLREQVQTSGGELLEATLRADRWQMRFEKAVETAKAAGVNILPAHKSDNEDLLSRRNGQLIDITQRLREAQSDAAVARATAGAVISGRGDIAAVDVSAFVLDYDTKNAYDNSHVDKNVENGDQEILSASMLHEMTGSIEKKENMARQLNLERECIERMQSHFQAAFENLQEEARVLSEEREDLLSKLNIQVSGREDSGGSQSNAEKERMKGRIDLLEKRIRELKLKASEHSKAIRMKEAAETKCAQLAAEIADDKKRRAALQRKLKEEAEERRSERSVARVHAARMLRDSQKLKYELNKVKDAAAKQGVVLRRKIDAIAKQKAAQEKKEKISAANRPSSSRGGLVQRYDSLKTELSDDGLDKWINDEIESASVLLDFHDRIEEQNKCLTEAFRNKEDLLSGMENSGPSSSDVDAIRSLDNEIDSRTRLLKDLQRSLSDVQKAQLNLLTVGSRAANEGLCSSSSFFADELKFRGFSRSELRVVATNTVHRIIIAKKNLDRLQEQHKKAISSSVKAAMLEEKRRCDEVLANLKMEHSEAIMLLLESTKNTVECTMSRSMLLATDGVIDESFRATVDEMLGQYMEGCSKVGAEVRQNLLEIKGNQDMMRDVVDKVANDIITSSTRVKQSKGNKGFTTAHVDDIESEEELSEGFIDETSILEDSDSDWDPGSPGRQGRLETRGEKVSNSNAGGDAKESDESESALASLTVSRLRNMLRERGLTVSGRKQELILRLQKVLASGFHNDAARADPKKVSPVKRPFRTPLGIANNIGELENHVMDDTIVFSAKKKPRTDEGRGTLRRQHMVAALSKALSDAENMLG